jgi:hypothetical protein
VYLKFKRIGFLFDSASARIMIGLYLLVSLLLLHSQFRHGEYKQSTRTSAGADKWINLRVWEQGTTQALTAIKSVGYQLIVTHLSKDAVPIQVSIQRSALTCKQYMKYEACWS